MTTKRAEFLMRIPEGVVGAVLGWGATEGLRDLPWRRTRDPWAVLVAEVMLQQTQVPRVIPKWEAFLAAYPVPADCAEAALGEVLHHWSGLGYPRRARHLHATATIVRDRHGGRLPDCLDDLLALPGIGQYTARAVLVFAHEREVGVVDTNIARFLARMAGRRLTGSAVQRLADSLVPERQAWDWNQLVMDLGATVCRPVPRCHTCPAVHWCAWYDAGRAEPDPAVGSANVSGRQAPFQGSARQARGQVLRALTEGRQPDAAIDEAVIASLEVDGLVVRRPDGALALP